MFSFFESENALLFVEVISELICQLFEVPHVLTNLKGNEVHILYILLLKITCLVSFAEDKSALPEDGVSRDAAVYKSFLQADVLVQRGYSVFIQNTSKVKWTT